MRNKETIRKNCSVFIFFRFVLCLPKLGLEWFREHKGFKSAGQRRAFPQSNEPERTVHLKEMLIE